MKKRYPLVFLFALVLVAGCDNPKPDTSAVPEELKSRKIRKIKEVQILEQAEKDGQAIIALLNKVPMDTTGSQCEIGSLEERAKTGKQYFAIVRKISDRPAAEANKPDSLEAQLLEAYLYNQSQHLPLTNTPPVLRENEVLYTSPILTSSSCLRCHGVPSKDIPAKQYETLRQKYPDDKAVNYTLNELRGIWSIRFDKRELVKRIP